MQVKDKDAEAETRGFEVWGQLGGGASINIGHGGLWKESRRCAGRRQENTAC